MHKKTQKHGVRCVCVCAVVGVTDNRINKNKIKQNNAHTHIYINAFNSPKAYSLI